MMPLFLHLFDIDLISRSKSSPHEQSAAHVGAGGEKHTWHVRSTWFALQTDMWVTLHKRQASTEQ